MNVYECDCVIMIYSGCPLAVAFISCLVSVMLFPTVTIGNNIGTHGGAIWENGKYYSTVPATVGRSDNERSLLATHTCGFEF